jgi:hypothetical protein
MLKHSFGCLLAAIANVALGQAFDGVQHGTPHTISVALAALKTEHNTGVMTGITFIDIAALCHQRTHCNSTRGNCC